MRVARAREITDFGSRQCLVAAAAAGSPFAGADPRGTDTRHRSTQGWEPRGARGSLVTQALPASPARRQAGLVPGAPGGQGQGHWGQQPPARWHRTEGSGGGCSRLLIRVTLERLPGER